MKKIDDPCGCNGWGKTGSGKPSGSGKWLLQQNGKQLTIMVSQPEEASRNEALFELAALVAEAEAREEMNWERQDKGDSK